MSIFPPEAIPSDMREIGHEAVWSLSTAKPGNGVEQLRDNNSDTYWQSDGGQPHRINIQFHKKMSISQIWFYLDYKLDESYTPKKICIRHGTTFHDLQDLHHLEVGEDPSGWIKVDLSEAAANLPKNKLGGYVNSSNENILRTHFIQVVVLSMHQNGRDTHIRQVKVFGPRTSSRHTLQQPGFTSLEFTKFGSIR
jgi:anaphase-promoting complex subunit 10